MEIIEERGLSTHGLSCIRDDRVLFENLELSLNPGELLQIEGHNGSGKTSLLRILCGLALPSEGRVCWQGESIEDNRLEYNAVLNYVGHKHGVKGDLTPYENLRVSRAMHGSATDITLDDALEQVGLRGFEDVPSRTLSAGQRRRVGLARLLTRQAALWILDEPFTSLDKKGIHWVEEQLHQHSEQGGIAVLTSHHPLKNPHLKQVCLHD
ncbi:cytochrome c biogenesis heme-transporting ATPase CcmA [Candidatus Venteria ishoeyi]|uniref:Cytochrome c biogenesis ATP-binding export protein CcmA n=1 Tax=Candidatus Venteria ishoeyi TaxID=1899563 RepID=A0A1H6FIT8_9GAMM|nr:cytochrome c biogenesis heme-transporting ATPase CcmA [Candidatus Venteria ishoeyi]MDM8547676.1 cytochrome c biogenesis heme-transporting ATPase CcmA [Candidatus Venteria ishoeyi]SEH09026.1 Cytochrome c biogenesis ATP-binding export protein CcmA [Candidatus Venteria ishoeyi]